MSGTEVFLGYLVAGFWTAYVAGDVFDAMKNNKINPAFPAFLFVALWPIALPLALEFHWNRWRGDQKRGELSNK